VKTLEQVLADWRGDAQVLRTRGHEHDARIIDDITGEVSGAAEEYLRFLSEGDARLRTSKSVEWLRIRFPVWMEQGHAKKIGNVRYYRMVVLPPRANVSAAREEGRRAGAA